MWGPFDVEERQVAKRGRVTQASVAASNVSASGTAGLLCSSKMQIKVADPTVQVRIKAP
jgi:hypothetical protein